MRLFDVCPASVCRVSDLSRPPGGYNPPPVFMRHPQPSEVQMGVIRGVYGGGVYVIVMEGVLNVVKY